jgi:hypothetical protein
MMRDEAVAKKTGRTWDEWFQCLDAAGAAELKHREIARLLQEKEGISGWWSQCITVEYELSRGLRERHRKSDGYSVSVTKTVNASLPRLYSAAANAAQRKKWFPRGVFEPSSQTKDKYLRGKWKKDSRLEFGFYPKGKGKAQIALGVNRLPTRADVDKERSAWKAALTKLKEMIESSSLSK